jgi:hypothetical protein
MTPRAKMVTRGKKPGKGTRKSADPFAMVREIGRILPGVEESTAFGQPALKIRGKLLACIASHRSAEPGSLVVRVDFADRDELLAADPNVYYVTEHYVGYTSVLVRLDRVSREMLRDLLGMAHKFVRRTEARPLPEKKGPKDGRRR